MAYTEKHVTTGGSEAWLTNSSVNPSSLTEAVTNATGGQRVNVLKGTYTLGANITLPAGTAENPIAWRGYDTTIGDLRSVGRATPTAALTITGTGTEFPVINGGASYVVTGGAYNALETLRIISGANATVFIPGTYNTAYRCSLHNSNTTLSACRAYSSASTYSTSVDCDFSVATNAAVEVARVGRSGFTGCRIWGTHSTPSATSIGVSLNDVSGCSGNLIFNIGIGIQVGPEVAIVSHNTIYNVTQAFNITGGYGGPSIVNNVAYDISGYLFAGTAGGNPALINNAGGLITSGRIQSDLGTILEEISSIALSADPFTNAASEDFTLNNTAGGGALCRGGSLFFGGFGDLGAVQHEETAGGGGIQMVRGMAGGMRG